MNTPKVAAALNTLSLGLAELAEALAVTESKLASKDFSPPQAHQTPQEASPFIDLPDTVFTAGTSTIAITQPQGSLSQCPKHQVPFTEGQYGAYCKQTTDDPAWGKQKGDRLWCRITPKNAADWLRITAAA